MGKDPDAMRASIEETRTGLGRDVDPLTEKVSPATSAVSDTTSRVAETAQQAPQMVRRRAEGNQLASGVIAFGLGWLVSTVLPSSRMEQEAAGAVKERAQDLAEPIKSELQTTMQEVKGNLQEAVESVKDSKVVEHRSDRVKDAVGGLRERVMGSASEASSQVGEVWALNQVVAGYPSGPQSTVEVTCSNCGYTNRLRFRPPTDDPGECENPAEPRHELGLG